jgi:uncharacterized glyoxalase superfamily protein PhnB
VPGPINFWDSARALGKRIEPGVGGRVLEVYDAATDDVLVLGRITVWEPGARLVYRSAVDDTEVDVRFDAIDGGTRVHVRQYLLPGGDPTNLALFWPRVIHWLVAWCRDRATEPDRRRRLARVSVGVHYADPPAAARWLADAFGFTSWDKIPAEGTAPSWIELHVDNVAILLFPLAGKLGGDEPATHTVWVYVDDLDRHFAHAKAHGAEIVNDIHQYGYRSYTANDLEGRSWTFVQAPPTMTGSAPAAP